MRTPSNFEEHAEDIGTIHSTDIFARTNRAGRVAQIKHVDETA
jgi:hypothetical protein